MNQSEIIETENYRIIQFSNHELDTFSAQWSSNARYLAFCGMDGTGIIWDRNTNVFSNFLIDDECDNLTLSWSPIQPIIGVLSSNGLFHYISVNRNLFSKIDLHEAFSTRITNHYSSSSLAWSPLGECIAVGINQNRILILNHKGIMDFCKIIVHSRLQIEIGPLIWHPSNFIIGAFDREIILYSNKGIRKNRLFMAHHPIEIMKYNKIHNIIAVTYDYLGENAQTTKKIDIINMLGKIIKTFNAKTTQPYGLAWSPNKRFIAECGESSKVFIHSLLPNIKDISIELGDVSYSVDWSPDGRILAVARIRAPPVLVEFKNFQQYCI